MVFPAGSGVACRDILQEILFLSLSAPIFKMGPVIIDELMYVKYLVWCSVMAIIIHAITDFLNDVYIYFN